MEVVSAYDLKKGKKVKKTEDRSFTRPLQFIPKSKKNKDWAEWNLDWLEYQGLKQIERKAKRLVKNYKLAEGVIDKADYIATPDNEYAEFVDLLQKDNPEVYELKFYPIIPNVIDALVSEFEKRSSRVMFSSVDDLTYNEIIQDKQAEIESLLLEDAERKLMLQLMEQDVDFEDPEIQQKIEEQTQPDVLMRLPEIENTFRRDYKVGVEIWASKMKNIDEHRFNMLELEKIAFKDMLVSNSEFWHFLMMEDDYKVELWDPKLTFYGKSPNERYVSNGYMAGNINVMSIADVIDTYGWKMTEEQQHSLENYYIKVNPSVGITGYQNEGFFYNHNLTYQENVEGPSTGMLQNLEFERTNFGRNIVDWILGNGEDYKNDNNKELLKVTTSYWKSQMKIGYLTSINEDGEVETDIVSEDFVVTEKPIYNTEYIKDKIPHNLIYGEHVEWLWVNQTWGGIKISSINSVYPNRMNGNGLEPIYIGINSNRITPLLFQFKGDDSIYECKLPVEGREFTDRSVESRSLVDKMKPDQIGYNMVKNQISDILIDEIGTVLAFDQNMLPKNSLGEDWGKGNYAKSFVAMKNHKAFPLDGSISNMENATAYQHLQKLDLSETERLMGRIQLANYFFEQGLMIVGFNPQRLGQQISQYDSASKIEQQVSASFSQTEKYFTQHSDELMPRVHQMRTDLAQFYQSTNPSNILKISTDKGERLNFEINGTQLLGRDINVYAITKINSRNLLEQIKSFAMQNNTAGMTIFDIGKVMKQQSLGELDLVLSKMQQDQEDKLREERQYQEQMQQNEIEARQQELQEKLDRDERMLDKRIRKDITVAEIHAAGYTAQQDFNENNQSDYIDFIKEVRESEQYKDSMDLKRKEMEIKQRTSESKADIERDKMQHERDMKNKEVEIAITNKNRYDFPPYTKKSSDKKEE